MGIGLEAAGGLSAVKAGLRQRMLDQIAAQERDRQAMESDRNFGLQERQFQSNEELKKATLDATIANRAGQEQDRQAGLAGKLADSIPGDTFIPEQDPAAKMMQAGGYGSLLKPQDATLPMGRDFVGPMPNGETPEQAQVGRPKGLLKVRSAKQIDTETDNQRQAAKDSAAVTEKAAELTRQQARDAETGRHNRAQENKPVATPTVVVQTVDDKGNPITKVVPKTAGSEFKKAPGAVTQNRLDSAKAVQQTGEDIIGKVSDPNIAAMLGPAMGRANSLREFIGNPPPELSGLAGQIESYALANMGVHGMRSAQGAEHIKSLLERKHTPASLIEAVRGLNGFSQHFLENAGQGSGSGTTSKSVKMRAPNGQETDVPADQVEHFKGLGAVVIK